MIDLRFICCVAGTIGAMSCSAKRPIEIPPQPEGAPLALLEQQPATGSIGIGDILHHETRQSLIYEVLDEDGQNVGQLIFAQPASQADGGEFTRIHKGIRTEHLQFNEEGDLVMTSVEDHKENAVSHFDPPMLVLPADLQANQPRRHEAAMRVVDASDPKKARESGRAKREITYTADQRIRVHERELNVKRIESRFSADLKLADAEELTVMFVAPGVGIIAEQSVEQVKVLGAFGKTTKRTLIREADR